MSEKRKKALVVYMAALFGVAFLIVSISLGIQINKNTLNATSAEKVVALQNEIQQLKNENKELEDNVENLETYVNEILEGFEHLEGKAYEATARIKGQQRLLEIYKYLTAYQQAKLEDDEEAMTLHLLQLQQAQQDAQVMDMDLYEQIQTILEENESETDE